MFSSLLIQRADWIRILRDLDFVLRINTEDYFWSGSI